MRRITPHIRNAARPTANRTDPAIRKPKREAGGVGSARPIRTRETTSRIRPETRLVIEARSAAFILPPTTLQGVLPCEACWSALRMSLASPERKASLTRFSYRALSSATQVPLPPPARRGAAGEHRVRVHGVIHLPSLPRPVGAGPQAREAGRPFRSRASASNRRHASSRRAAPWR
jgi:hypothetical protein